MYELTALWLFILIVCSLLLLFSCGLYAAAGVHRLADATQAGQEVYNEKKIQSPNRYARYIRHRDK